MTSWQKNDWLETQEQLKNPNPIHEGKNWLRHGEHTQAALIDLMILEGKHSIKDIAVELNKKFKKTATINACIQRAKDHMEHLQQGSSRDKISGRKGHQLKLEEVSGKWRFVKE